MVNNADAADACCRQIHQHRCAKPAGANDQHLCIFQLVLAGAANFRHHDVAGVTFQF